MIDESKIFVLDDDRSQALIIERMVDSPVMWFGSISALQEALPDLKPKAFFIDIHLGTSENGLKMLPILKEHWPFCPILVMTGDRKDGVVGEALASGGDDFIFKPLEASETVARLQARMAELAQREEKEVLTVGDLTIDLSHRIVSNAKEYRCLSPTEMNLITCLVHARGTVVTRDTMKRKCWGQIYVSDNALNRKLHEVRRVLSELSDGVEIRTIYGTGFSIQLKGAQRRPHI